MDKRALPRRFGFGNTILAAYVWLFARRWLVRFTRSCSMFLFVGWAVLIARHP